MAGQEPTKPLTKEELVAQIGNQREALDREVTSFGQSVSPKARWLSSVSKHPVGWIAGTTLAGVAGARFLFGKSKPRTKMSLGVGKGVTSLVFPLVGIAAKAALNHYGPLIESRLRQHIDGSQPEKPPTLKIPDHGSENKGETVVIHPRRS